MKSYLIKRLVLVVPLLMGVSMLTFGLTKALPGDPVLGLVGERASPEVIERIRRELGTDRGIGAQYIGYLTLIAQGEFGRSYYTNRPVIDDITAKLPNTIALAAGAMMIAIPAGFSLGFLCAVRRNTLLDRLISVFTVAGMSFPVFWSGLVIMFVFSLTLGLLPPSGTGGIRFLILPAVTLSLPALGALARITRTTVLDVTGSPFLKTAYAKGMTERAIYFVHVARNAMIPAITFTGLEFASYLNGAVLTETIFGWDGIGRFTMEGIMKRDYPVVMGCVITGTVLFILINLLVDILYHVVDPRVRTDESFG